MLYIDTDPRRVVIASQSISEEATFFTIPHAYRKTRAHNTQGPPLTPRGGIAAAPPPPPPMQQEEDDDDDDLEYVRKMRQVSQRLIPLSFFFFF